MLFLSRTEENEDTEEDKELIFSDLRIELARVTFGGDRRDSPFLVVEEAYSCKSLELPSPKA